MISCTKCNLSKFRRNIVEGRGFYPADVLIIGEAPGITEDMEGKAFVGVAGDLLNKLIYDASQSIKFLPVIFITNTVLCRPTDSIVGDNRQPVLDEIITCRPNVFSIINKVYAKEVILAGDIAEKAFKKDFPHYTKIMHPSGILRNGGYGSGYYQMALRSMEKVFRKIKEI